MSDLKIYEKALKILGECAPVSRIKDFLEIARHVLDKWPDNEEVLNIVARFARRALIGYKQQYKENAVKTIIKQLNLSDARAEYLWELITNKSPYNRAGTSPGKRAKNKQGG